MQIRWPKKRWCVVAFPNGKPPYIVRRHWLFFGAAWDGAKLRTRRDLLKRSGEEVPDIDWKVMRDAEHE